MKKNKQDYLKFTNINIYQDDEMFCINSDTAILGMSLDFKAGLDILDIGTNNGALLLYASLLKPKSLTGIDIHEKAVNLAKDNLLMNNVKANIYLSKVQDHVGEYDIIITNPPFFKVTNLKQNEYKNKAMFEIELTIDELFVSFKRLLKDKGLVYMIYDAFRLNEIYENAFKYKLSIETIRFVYDSNKPYAKRVFVKIKKGSTGTCKVFKPIIIQDGIIKL